MLFSPYYSEKKKKKAYSLYFSYLVYTEGMLT